MILPGTARIEFEVARGPSAILIGDGSSELPLEAGSVVRIAISPLRARFVRLGEERQFYANLAKRLGWLRIDHALGPDAERPR